MTARLAAAAACVLAPMAASGATICVNPADPSCRRTIQQGVNAAAPGDTVQVAPGRYREAVIIPVTKPGIHVAGSGPGTTIMEAPDISIFNVAVWIRASDVEVRDIGIRGTAIGVVVDGFISNVVVRGMRLLGMRSDPSIVVAGQSDGVQILDNEIRGGRIAIQLGFTTGVVVAGNRISQHTFGILADGAHGAEIRGNQITTAGFWGIRASGENVRVVDNVLIDVSERALDVSGPSPMVEDNRLRHTGQSRVVCTPCTGGALRNNVSHSVLPSQVIDGIAWNLQADAPGLVVEDNLVSRPAFYGFVLDGEGIRLARNVVIEELFTPGQAFRIHGQEHQLMANAAVRSAGSGFEVYGSGHVLEDDTSSGTGLAGFVVRDATGTTLRRDVAAGSRAAGFAILPGGFATRLFENRGARNRYDFCDDGVDTMVFGTQFATSSSVCDILN